MVTVSMTRFSKFRHFGLILSLWQYIQGLLRIWKKIKTTLTTKIAALGQNLIVFIAKIENIF